MYSIHREILRRLWHAGNPLPPVGTEVVVLSAVMCVDASYHNGKLAQLSMQPSFYEYGQPTYWARLDLHNEIEVKLAFIVDVEPYPDIIPYVRLAATTSIIVSGGRATVMMFPDTNARIILVSVLLATSEAYLKTVLYQTIPACPAGERSVLKLVAYIVYKKFHKVENYPELQEEFFNLFERFTPKGFQGIVAPIDGDHSVDVFKALGVDAVQGCNLATEPGPCPCGRLIEQGQAVVAIQQDGGSLETRCHACAQGLIDGTSLPFKRSADGSSEAPPKKAAKAEEGECDSDATEPYVD